VLSRLHEAGNPQHQRCASHFAWLFAWDFHWPFAIRSGRSRAIADRSTVRGPGCLPTSLRTLKVGSRRVRRSPLSHPLHSAPSLSPPRWLRNASSANRSQTKTLSAALRWPGIDRSRWGGCTHVTKARVEPELVEVIARRVVELLRTEQLRHSTRLVDAATLAHELGVERDWVYANAERLGAIRLSGPKGRLRFNREFVAEQLGALGAEARPAQRLLKQRGGRATRQRKREPRGNHDRRAQVKSSQTQRRASGRTPARSPKQHQTGGSPHDEA
jgi:hypothetical protein